MIKDSALRFLASIYQSTLSHPCSKTILGSSLALAAGKAPSWCSHWGLHAPRHEEASAPATISTQLTWQKYQLRSNHSKTEIRYPPMANRASKIQLPKSMRKFPSQLFCGAWSKPSSYTLITEIIINTKNSQIHPFALLGKFCVGKETCIWGILLPCPAFLLYAAQSVQHIQPRDLISIRPRQVIIWTSWNLHAKLSCSTWAVTSGMLRTDSLTVNRHSQQWINKPDPDIP